MLRRRLLVLNFLYFFLFLQLNNFLSFMMTLFLLTLVHFLKIHSILYSTISFLQIVSFLTECIRKTLSNKRSPIRISPSHLSLRKLVADVSLTTSQVAWI